MSSQKQLDASGCLLLVHNAAFFGFASTTVEATKLCPLSSEEIFKKVLVCRILKLVVCTNSAILCYT